MSQIHDMMEVRVRKHWMKLPRAQAAKHQTPEKHLACKWWACILQREKGRRQTHQACTDMLTISQHSPSQTPRLPELMKAMHLKRLTITLACWWVSPVVLKVLAEGGHIQVVMPRHTYDFPSPFGFLSFFHRENQLFCPSFAFCLLQRLMSLTTWLSHNCLIFCDMTSKEIPSWKHEKDLPC